MSHQVVINYEGISIKLQAQCDSFISSLCRIDKELDFVHKTASQFESKLIKDYEKQLTNSKATLKREIEAFKAELERVKALRKSSNVSLQYEINAKASRLGKLANELAGSKLDVIRSMISNEFSTAIKDMDRRLSSGVDHIEALDSDLLSKIDSIDDMALKNRAYRLAISKDNKRLSFSDLLKKAKESLSNDENAALNKNKERILFDARNTLKENGVSESVIKDLSEGNLTVDKLNKIHETVQKEVVDEKVRKQTLKIIIKALKSRGFIINTKENLKIDRATNKVKLLALKPDGRQAEFEVSLNGKFMYHFDGYEGQACQKDIKPFMDDLENVYGIKVLKQEVIWSNPDKISTQKYQRMDVNKGKN